ncbi:MAG: imidazole glycerol phosphate synthase subunit HisF [Oscillospiraceae bacterium]|jgi:cyclase|nr:imidazole glycerol phosphate synthase subunit HisF [Oscillospiraceae bacterium]
MYAKRIIPCLDIKNGRVVKGTSFVGLRDAGDPVACARLYDEMDADELVLLDIMASHEGRGTMLDIVRQVAAQVFIPFTVGGGINRVADFTQMLRAGADKCSVNSAAVRSPQLIADAAEKFGSQCVVLAIDARRTQGSRAADTNYHPETPACIPAELLLDETSRYEVYLNGGRVPTGIDALRWAKYGVALGAGEILLTSMDADGQKDGYELPLTASISGAVSVPVIASGGAGKLEHFYDALTLGKADAVLAASLFHFGELTVSQVKDYLHERGLAARQAFNN